MATATLENVTAEYMSLADGVGIIPEKFRNGAYAKLDFEPGEGGIGIVLAAAPASHTSSGISIESFLAGIAAGADPREFATQLLGGDAEAKAAPEAASKRQRRNPAASTE